MENILKKRQTTGAVRPAGRRTEKARKKPHRTRASSGSENGTPPEKIARPQQSSAEKAPACAASAAPRSFR